MLIAKFNLSIPGAGGLLFSTYLGGKDVDRGWGIAVDSKGNAHITGGTFSSDFPTLIPFQSICDGCTSFLASPNYGDDLLTKVCISACAAVNLSPSSIAFGNQNVGTTSATQTVRLWNPGSGDLTVAGITITGANAADFSETNSCQSVLPPHISCNINVAFSPAASGSRIASLMISDDVPGAPQTVSLSGTGVAPTVNLSSSGLSFGNQATNTTSVAQNVTLTNNGPGALTISGISITGTNAADFGRTNNCPVSPTTLAVNATCSISVTFTPKAGGGRVAGMTITDNGSCSPQSINLSGTGVVAPRPKGYSYQATFTVAAGQVASAQSNFPALISGTFADFKTVANGGRVANLCRQTVRKNSLSVPCDLVFASDAAGTTLLTWEFESYNATTGAVNIWVKVPSLSNGMVIYGWYGRSSITTLQTTPASTWSNNWQAVYHLKEDPTGAAPQMKDSTGNANHGTMNGTVQSSQQQPGEIGGSLNSSAAQAMAETNPVTTGVWHYVVDTYSGTSTVAGMSIYVDGVNQAPTTIKDALTVSIVNAITPAIYGRGGSTSMSSDGIEEVRISAKGVVLAPEWVTSSYNNQSNPGAFFTAVTGLIKP
jgi:hypothetical protein